jgi:hypothetical protein
MPKPVLQAMVLADHVYQDRNTGKFVIAGTFGTIWRQPAPPRPTEGEGEGAAPKQLLSGPITQMGSPYLYLALADVHGKVPLSLRLIDLSDGNMMMEANFEVASVDPLTMCEFILPMPLLPAMKPGALSLDLLFQNEILGSWRINVRDVPPPQPAEPTSEHSSD